MIIACVVRTHYPTTSNLQAHQWKIFDKEYKYVDDVDCCKNIYFTFWRVAWMKTEDPELYNFPE